jgi:hypothetical protein
MRPVRYERESGQLLPGVPIGCFPDPTSASGNMPDQVITL